jgi:hypothetical protein
MNKFIFIELLTSGDPVLFATYATKKELKDRYNRRAAIHGNSHLYYGYHVQRQLTLKF